MIGEDGEARAHWFWRNQRIPAMKSADSGVKFPQPGGELSEGKEGERQRGSWPFYTRGRGVD
jgi:hypothetical protein